MALLCFSRDFQADLFSRAERHFPVEETVHLVMNRDEAARVRSVSSGAVYVLADFCILSTAELVSEAAFELPDDFGAVTDFPYDPILADRFLRKRPPHEAAVIAGRIFRCIEDIFSKHRITHVLNECVAQFPAHVLLYFARKQGARPLFCVALFLPSHFVMVDGIDASHVVVPERPQYDEAEAARLVDAYLSEVRKGRVDLAYVKSFFGRPSVSRETYRVGRALAATCKAWATDRGRDSGDYIAQGDKLGHVRNAVWRFRSTVTEFDDPADIQSGDVFFPLHLVPEAALSYCGYEYESQQEAVRMIAASLPTGARLWVKEHPQQAGALLSSEWASARQDNKKLRILPGWLSIRPYFSKFTCTVTVASTAGIDSLVHGTPTVVLGRPYFRDFHSVVAVDDIRQIGACMAKATRDGLHEKFRADAIAIARKAVAGRPYVAPDLLADATVREFAQGVAAFLPAASATGLRQPSLNS
jgi:hypothetical protein